MTLLHQLQLRELQLSAQFLKLFLMGHGQVFQFISRVRLELHLAIMKVSFTVSKPIFNVPLLQDSLHLLIFDLKNVLLCPIQFFQTLLLGLLLVLALGALFIGVGLAG